MILPLAAAWIYWLFQVFFSAEAWRRRLERRGAAPEAAAVRAVLLQRWSGGLWLGAAAAATWSLVESPLAAWGVLRAPPRAGLLPVLAAALLILPVLELAARRPQFRRHYPELRAAQVPPALVAHGAGAWAVYLLGYEFFFRGFLLFPLAEELGPGPAIAWMTALYVFVHLVKNAGESFGTLISGPLFGWLAWSTGSIWAPYLLHLAVALYAENRAGILHPDIQWGRRAAGASATRA